MDSDSYSLTNLLRIIKNRIWIVIISIICGLGIAATYSFVIAKPQYSADVLLYIWQDSKSGSADSNYSDMMLFAQLVNDYQILCTSRLVTTAVAQEIGLDQAAAARLEKQIAVSTKNNTRHLMIKVIDGDPAQAALIANTVSTVFARVVVENMGAGQVKIIDAAIVPTQPSSPNKQLNLTVGLFAGLIFGVLLVIVVEELDTRVKTIADVEAITGFAHLGGVPAFEFETQSRGRRR